LSRQLLTRLLDTFSDRPVKSQFGMAFAAYAFEQAGWWRVPCLKLRLGAVGLAIALLQDVFARHFCC
jgi:hypothetical protein